MTTQNDDPMLSAAEAAAYMGRKESTLARDRMLLRGPRYCKLGRTVRYRRSDLDAWIDARVVHTNDNTEGNTQRKSPQ